MVDAETVKQWALDEGFDLVGIARAQTPPHYESYKSWVEQGMHGEMDYLQRHLLAKAHPNHLLEGCKSVIVVALIYNQPNPTERYKVAKYALGRDYHKVITQKLDKIASKLQEVSAATRVCVDAQPLMERDFAQLAGIGWFGKNTMIINSKSGSWFLLGFLLTDLELEPDQPAVGGCGTCRACLDACPTGAILPRGDYYSVDATRCISYLTIEAKQPTNDDLGNWVFGCDICQDACPFNQPRESQPERAPKTTCQDFLDLKPIVQMLADNQTELTKDRWDEATPGSPVRRAGLAKVLARIEAIDRKETQGNQ